MELASLFHHHYMVFYLRSHQRPLACNLACWPFHYVCKMDGWINLSPSMAFMVVTVSHWCHHQRVLLYPFQSIPFRDFSFAIILISVYTSSSRDIFKIWVCRSWYTKRERAETIKIYTISIHGQMLGHKLLAQRRRHFYCTPRHGIVIILIGCGESVSLYNGIIFFVFHPTTL